MSTDGEIPPPDTEFPAHFEVTYAYFRALGTRILEGRGFLERPRSGDREVVLGASVASHLFPEGGAVGRTVDFLEPNPELMNELRGQPLEQRRAYEDFATWVFTPHIVVGVVEDIRMFDWDIERLALYTDFRQNRPATGTVLDRIFRPGRFVLRITGDSEVVVDRARSRLREVEPNLLIERIVFLEDATSRAIGGAGSNMLLLVVSVTFGTLSLLLAAVGIYGVMSHSVTRRTYEVGVRMALGADASSVLRMVLGRSLRLTVLGLSLGLAGAWAVTRILESLLFAVTPTDPLTFIGATVFLLIVAMAASFLPARRAARVDPLVATRAE